MAQNFNAGDIVQLKSGGPSMTISEETGTGKYICVWFKGASREQAAFSPDVLKLYEAPKKND